ncbi:MAG: hypothetical protein HQ553_01690 [Chloroflexi bacterium]|nr:hypothetical protein [Chloroflexota bacterium]
MATRKKTPDILGDLLGGSESPAEEKESKTEFSEGEQATLPIKEFGKRKTVRKTSKSKESDVDYFESLLDRGAGALELVAEVLGRNRIVQWLDEMKKSFGEKDAEVEIERGRRKSPSIVYKQRVANWVENNLGAASATIDYPANGLSTRRPYEVDVWGHMKGESSRNDIEIWVECKSNGTAVKRRDISTLVKRAIDVFHAAHTVKQEFWFDRLMLVSATAFEDGALELADEEGVTCIQYDETGCQFMTEDNWKLKPSWLRDAEAGRGRD